LQQHERWFSEPLIQNLDYVTNAPDDYNDHENGEYLDGKTDDSVKKPYRKVFMFQVEIMSGFMGLGNILFFVHGTPVD
jgi:hypothetical protein